MNRFEKISIQVLKLFEQHSIDKLAYTIVNLSDDRPGDYTLIKKTRN